MSDNLHDFVVGLIDELETQERRGDNEWSGDMERSAEERQERKLRRLHEFQELVEELVYEEPGSRLQLVQVDEFEAIGPEEDPASRLLACVEINGVKHHLEALAVTLKEVSDGSIQQFPDEDPEYFSLLWEAFAAEGHWYTTEIQGRSYALVLSPYCS